MARLHELLFSEMNNTFEFLINNILFLRKKLNEEPRNS
jgi:hypothetical protein